MWRKLCTGLAAAVAVTLACWSRYELWPLAPLIGAHAALCAWAEPEGRAREYLCINGIWQDHLLYARLSGDRP